MSDLHRVAEAMREACAELAGHNVDLIRRNGYTEKAEAMLTIAQRIRKVDIGSLVDSAINAPPASADEIATFEAEARRLRITDFRRNVLTDGSYSYGLTQRFWEMWRAGQRFAKD